MASVFRQTYKRPLPQSAELFTRKGVPMARWLDGRGRKRTAPVAEDGSSVVLEYTCWYVSYTDAARDRQTVRGFRDKEASERLGADLERRAERERAGLPVADHGKLLAPWAKQVAEYLSDMV